MLEMETFPGGAVIANDSFYGMAVDWMRTMEEVTRSMGDQDLSRVLRDDQCGH